MKYNGIITPMLTPFRQDGTPDPDATNVLIDYLKKTGVSGLFPLGSTGLFPYLFSEERVNFLQQVNYCYLSQVWNQLSGVALETYFS